MIVSAIVATASNRVIGKDNDIPWYLPADLKYFKKTTLNHHILMGRKSFQSIGKPLPKRTNVIITRNPYFIATNCLVASSLEEALEIAYDNGEKEAFIIGGGEIYRQSIPLLDRLYLTEVAIAPEGSVYFPELNWDEWTLVSEEAHEPDEKNEHAYVFKIFDKKPTE